MAQVEWRVIVKRLDSLKALCALRIDLMLRCNETPLLGCNQLE